MRTLLVEDEPQLASQIRQGLEAISSVVDIVNNSAQAWVWTQGTAYDCIILELWSPLIDGLNLCRRLRRQGHQTPILLLTGDGATDERVIGLEAGADDCLSKPFNLLELLARLHALSRQRVAPQPDLTLTVADLQLNLRTYQARRGNLIITLSAREMALLALLMRHPNQIFTRKTILQQAWNRHHHQQQPKVVDLVIHSLRRKIDDPFAVKFIQTVPSLGYLLQNPYVPNSKLSLR